MDEIAAMPPKKKQKANKTQKICQHFAFAPHLNFKREKSSTERARDTDAAQ